MMRPAFKATLIVVAATLLACGCSNEGERTMHWTETVALSDGTVEIARFVRYHFRYSVGVGGMDTGQGERESTLKLVSKSAASATWSAPLIPLLLEREPQTAEWVIVASTHNCEYWREHGEPDPQYWAWRLHSGAWTPIAVPSAFFGRKPNLFFNYRSDEHGDMTRTVRERKPTQVTAEMLPAFQRIVRAGEARILCDRATK
jgi:hypothetical protein